MLFCVLQARLNVEETSSSVEVDSASLTDGFVMAELNVKMAPMNLQMLAVSWLAFPFLLASTPLSYVKELYASIYANVNT